MKNLLMPEKKKKCGKAKPQGNTELNCKKQMYQPFKTNSAKHLHIPSLYHVKVSWLGFHSASSTGLESKLILSNLAGRIIAFSYSLLY